MTATKRTKLNAWDLALIDWLLHQHLREIPEDQSVYRGCIADLAERISQAKMGSLTTERAA